jgi:hypothetical protein
MEETDMCHLIVSAFPQQIPSPQQSPVPQQTSCAAKAMPTQARQLIAVQALAGNESIADLAAEHEVSRKFVYRQKAIAEQALHDAFASNKPDDKVLFYLPVTKAWLRQFILALILICHSSYRGVIELLRDLFCISLSIGTVHNVLHSAVAKATHINQQQNLSTIDIGLNDEIFQSTAPVLVGIDAASTYCYLLSVEQHRDADTWGVHLLDLKARGFNPKAIIADFGSGLRAGQKLALPDTPCWGDIFHALQEVQTVATFLEKRAYDALAARDKLEHKQSQNHRRRGRRDASIGQKLRLARATVAKAVPLADDVALLANWLQRDVLGVVGPDYAQRCQLYDFIVAELRTRQPLCPHRLQPLCTLLTNHRDELLAFAAQLDRDLQKLAEDFEAPVELIREAFNLQEVDPRQPQYWQREAALRRQLGDRFYPLRAAVQDLADHVVRASSLVENYNSRLRNYFFLRRVVGPDYLQLLQFFLNHRRYLRSEHPERVGRSPAELLTGQRHPHWLELLGYKMLCPAAE